MSISSTNRTKQRPSLTWLICLISRRNFLHVADNWQHLVYTVTSLKKYLFNYAAIANYCGMMLKSHSWPFSPTDWSWSKHHLDLNKFFNQSCSGWMDSGAAEHFDCASPSSHLTSENMSWLLWQASLTVGLLYLLVTSVCGGLNVSGWRAVCSVRLALFAWSYVSLHM